MPHARRGIRATEGGTAAKGDRIDLLAEVSAAVGDEFFDNVLLHAALTIVCYSTRLRLDGHEPTKFNFQMQPNVSE